MMQSRGTTMSVLIVVLGLALWVSADFGHAATERHGAAHGDHHVGERPLEEIQYSEFNHRSAGVFVILLGMMALAMEVGSEIRTEWRSIQWLWPAGWVGYAFYLFVRNDPGHWPWGPIGFWETITNPETGQHKLFCIIVLAMGVVEGWRVHSLHYRARVALVFPTLGLIASLILGGHAQVHVATPTVYWQHMSLAALGIGVCVSRILRDQGIIRGWTGLALWPTFLLLFGVQLLFYTEQ